MIKIRNENIFILYWYTKSFPEHGMKTKQTKPKDTLTFLYGKDK